MRDICRAAGVNVAAINYHFGDKLGLYREVVQGAIDAIRATTESARSAGQGFPADERLLQYLRLFLRRLLTRGSSSVQKLVHKEMSDPTPELDRLVEEGVRPRLAYLSELVAEILGCPVNDARVLPCVFSIQAQTMAVARNPIGARLGFAPRPADADAIAEHVARFSLGGIRAMASSSPPVAGAASPPAHARHTPSRRKGPGSPA